SGSVHGSYLSKRRTLYQTRCASLLDLVDGASYLPEGVRAAEIDNSLDALEAAHRGVDNFYNEPPAARQLETLVGEKADVPRQVARRYVLVLVEVFLTNGHGVAWNSEPIYLRLIEKFDSRQAGIALTVFTDKTIASRLQLSLAQDKFRELQTVIRPKLARRQERELADAVGSFKGPLDHLKDDASIKRLLAAAVK
ncbi:MAG: hypothetical protein ABR507_01020, partial [Actinomycetota bacterium]